MSRMSKCFPAAVCPDVVKKLYDTRTIASPRRRTAARGGRVVGVPRPPPTGQATECLPRSSPTHAASLERHRHGVSLDSSLPSAPAHAPLQGQTSLTSLLSPSPVHTELPVQRSPSGRGRRPQDAFGQGRATRLQGPYAYLTPTLRALLIRPEAKREGMQMAGTQLGAALVSLDHM